MEYSHLKLYARFLLDNYLDELAATNLSKAREVELPMLALFSHLSEYQLFTYAKESVERLLLELSDGTALQKFQLRIQDWKMDLLPSVPKAKLDLQDLVLSSYIRKYSLVKLLHHYTQDITQYEVVVQEIDTYYTSLQTSFFQAFISIQQEELRKEKEFLTTIIDHTVDGITAYDTNGHITLWNRAVEERTGLSREKALGKNMFELFPSYEHTADGQAVKQVLQGEKVHLQDMPMRGNRGFYEADLVPLLNKRKEVMGGLTVSRDITTQKMVQQELYEKNAELTQAMEELRSTQDLLMEANNDLDKRVQERTEALSASEEELRQTLDQAVELNVKLSEQENFLSNIIGQSPFSTWIADANGTAIQVNQACMDLFGITAPTQVVGKYSILQDPTFMKQPFYPDIQAVFQEGKVAKFEMTYQAGELQHVDIPTEKPISIVFTVFPIKDNDEKVVNAVIQHEDITERKKAENALIASEAQLRLITDALPGLISYIDAEEKYRFNNKAYEDWFHKSREEIYGKHLEEVMGHEAYHTVKENTRKALSGEEVSYEASMNYEFAGLRYVATHFIPRVEQGKVMGFYALVTDITERKKAEEIIKESAARFSLLLESIPQMAWTALPDGSLNYYNQRWYEFTGQSPEEALKQGWQPILHPDDGPITIEKWQYSLQTGCVFDLKRRFKRISDGMWRWHLTRGVPLSNEKGEIVLWVGTCTDIHDQIMAEEEMKLKNLELQKINNDLDNFIYTASHDLKAPIANIEGLTTILYKRMKIKGDDSETNIMNLINQSISKFKLTIKDLTEITKAQKDLAEEKEEVSFEEILEEVKADIGEIIRQSDALIIEDLQIDRITYAKRNLRSIFYNLLSNAIKYRSPERPIEIHVNTFEKDGFVVLQISDNGLGLSAAQQNKLFGMFKRMHSHVEGTGIGLYIIKRIIENNRGKIEVQSELNQGTQFNVYFNTLEQG